MDVKHALPGVASGIRHHSITRLIDPLGLRQLAGGGEDLSQDPRVVVGELRPIGNVVLRNEQDVSRCGRVDIAKRNDLTAVQDHIGGNLPPNDLAEETILRHGREFTSRGAGPRADGAALTAGLLDLGNDVRRRDRVANVGFVG